MAPVRWPSWWLLGPLFLGAGLALGRLLPRAPEPLWTGPERPPKIAADAAHALPSLSPIVDRAAGAVVGVHALRRMPGEAGEHGAAVSNGTGFLVNRGGLCVTSRHVVAGAHEITLWLAGGAPYRAVLVGEDPLTDLAFVRLVAPPENLPALELGRSEDLHAGDWIVCIGSPFGMPRTVTVGTVSFVGRHLMSPARVSNDYLQFSAAVNEGSSGGPVLDLAGRVVGVTTQAMPAAQGMSFAVPSRTLKWALQAADQSKDGRVHRGYLGIEFMPRPGPRFGEWEPGVVVTRVLDDSPAAGAGIVQGDIVHGIDGAPVRDAYELHERLSRTLPGTTIELLLRRGERQLPVVAVQLGEAEPPGTQPG